MATIPEPLNYSTQPKRRWPLRVKVVMTTGVCAVLFAIAIFLRGGLLTSADIRLDTGDLRYRYLGFPLTYERMPEPQRSQLLALAANSKMLQPRWVMCASFPLRTSNNTHVMCEGWYYKAAVWAAEDPQLARLMLEDVASHISMTNARYGLPASSSMLSGFFVEPNAQGVLVVKSGWQQDEIAVAYTSSKGYIAPTTAPGR